MKRILFDENCPNYEKEHQYNVMFLTQQERWINDRIRFRGYVYLNQIYESLGLGWDPKRKNKCFIKDKDKMFFINWTVVENGLELEFEFK